MIRAQRSRGDILQGSFILVHALALLALYVSLTFGTLRAWSFIFLSLVPSLGLFFLITETTYSRSGPSTRYDRPAEYWLIVGLLTFCTAQELWKMATSATVGDLFNANELTASSFVGAALPFLGLLWWFAPRVLPIAVVERSPQLLLLSRGDVCTYCLFSLFAKVLRADGAIEAREISAIVDFMNDQLRLSESAKNFARRAFSRAKDNILSAEHYAHLFHDRFGLELSMTDTLIDTLLWVATTDGSFSRAEESVIRKVADTFSFNEQRYQALRESNLEEAGIRKNATEDRARQEQGSRTRQRAERRANEQTRERRRQDEEQQEKPRSGPGSRCYQVLGCRPEDSFESIKSRFHKLLKEHHPDRLASKGLPSELLVRANRRCQEIIAAFDEVRELRGEA